MCKVRVELLSWLAEALGFEGKSQEVVLEVEINGDKTVRDLFGRLAVKYPRFGQLVYDVNRRSLTERVNIFLNNNQLELVDGLETKLRDGDVLTLVEPVEGG